MKIAKRIAAIGAAMVMAVSMMSVGASAATINKGWLLRRVTTPGAPTSLTIRSQKNLFQAPWSGACLYRISDYCSSYSSGTSSNGDEDYVNFCVYLGDKTGNTINRFIFRGLLHRSADTTVNKYFGEDVDYGYNLLVRYNLNGPLGIPATMTGTGTVYRR